MEDMEVMVVTDMEDIMVKRRSFRIKPKKTLKTTQSISITKIATVLSSVRIFKILNNEREIKFRMNATLQYFILFITNSMLDNLHTLLW